MSEGREERGAERGREAMNRAAEERRREEGRCKRGAEITGEEERRREMK